MSEATPPLKCVFLFVLTILRVSALSFCLFNKVSVYYAVVCAWVLQTPPNHNTGVIFLLRSAVMQSVTYVSVRLHACMLQVADILYLGKKNACLTTLLCWQTVKERIEQTIGRKEAQSFLFLWRKGGTIQFCVLVQENKDPGVVLHHITHQHTLCS